MTAFYLVLIYLLYRCLASKKMMNNFVRFAREFSREVNKYLHLSLELILMYIIFVIINRLDSVVWSSSTRWSQRTFDEFTSLVRLWAIVTNISELHRNTFNAHIRPRTISEVMFACIAMCVRYLWGGMVHWLRCRLTEP